MLYDAIIIGAGVVGAFISRELSRYKLNICLIEKESDVAMGSSKANSSIVHAGYDAVPGSLKARLNVPGNEMMEQVSRELDVPFKRTGSLVLAFKGDDTARLRELMERGLKNGVKGLEILPGEKVREMEPNVSEDVAAALYAPTAGTVCPYELTIGAVENAVANGAELKLEAEVKGIAFEDGRFTVYTDKEELKCRYLVNAAGIYADKISAMTGDDSFFIKPRKGEYLLFDKSQGRTVSRIIFQLPTEKGKGVLVVPTIDGNLMIGPNAEDIEDREDVATTAGGLEQVIGAARKAVPALDMREVITSFAGLRAKPSTEDFLIQASKVNNRFINVSGIDSPGLTCAPAIGPYVADILKSQGLELKKKEDFNPVRERVVRTRKLSEEELSEVIGKNPLYGRIVCRCEKVSEGEVVDCIRRPAGAKNLDGIKKRTRTGMGRCQGGFCTPRLVEILSRELGIPVEEVTKKGGESRLLHGKTK